MAIVAYELALNGNSNERDRQGKASAVRRFVVETISPQAAQQAEGIPALSSEHPQLPGLRLDRYTVTPTSDGICYVECQYSNDSRFVNLRTPNKDNPRWFHWGWASKKVQVEIPIAIRSKVLNTSTTGTEVEKLVWKIGKKQLSETRVVRPLQVRVYVSNVRNLDIIAEQTDKLHVMPDGKTYHFEGANVNQVDDLGNYDITYTWERDEGTFFFPAFSSENAKYCRQVDGPLDGSLARYPYTVFAAYQIGNPQTDLPLCETNELYDMDENGWQQLPGASRIL